MTEVEILLGDIRSQANKCLRITGPTQIEGCAYVQGSKNTANKLVAVTVALPGKYKIANFPKILDPLELLYIVELLGGRVSFRDSTVYIDTTELQNKPLPYALTKSTTSAFGFAGGLLGRFGRVQIGKPGGDDIGPRPIDLHVESLQSLGAEIEERTEEISGHLPVVPHDKRFKLRMPSTGAAVNFILAVAASHGSATLENAPKDSDMDTMYELLRATGVTIKAAKSAIHVDASGLHHSTQTIHFTCSPDRNDTFTWLCYGALSSKGLLIERLSVKDIEQGLGVLRSLGVEIAQKSETSLLVRAASGNTTIPTNIIIAGLGKEFHSDWAPLLEVVLSTLHGESRVIDTLFSNRVRQAELLQKMGADIRISGGQPPAGITLHFSTDPDKARYLIDINGPTELRALNTDVGYDVRACAAIVMAASQAHGTSTLSQVQALYRGYENVIERLSQVGLDITTP